MVGVGGMSQGNGSTRLRPLVLIVDDDEGIRGAIADLLEDEGFATAQAADGAEALNFLADSSTPPVLILLDLMMPVVDGWTFCKVRQGVQSLMEIPIIAVSAAPMVGTREPLRVEATLSKPFDPDRLAWLIGQTARKERVAPRRSVESAGNQDATG
jgi:two-component system, OmpR family, response regulator